MGYQYSPGAGQDPTTYKGPPSSGRIYRPPRPKAKPVRPAPKPPKKPVRKPYVDPFAPKTDAQLQAEASAWIRAQYDPIIKQIQDAINARSQSGMSSIAGLTQSLGGLLSGVGPAIQGIYQQAQGSEAATNQQLANQLGQFGQNLSGEQAAKLALQNAPGNVVGQVAGGTGQLAQGVANANYAKGNAGVEQLIAQGAASGAYGAKLPGIAALTGMQHGRDLQAQLAHELASQLGDVNSKIPGAVADYLKSLQDNELQKAAYRQSGAFNQQKLAADQAYKRQQMAYKKKKDAYDRQIQRQKMGISLASVQERARHDGITEAQAQQRIANERRARAQADQRRRDQNRRQTNWRVDKNGNFVYRKNKNGKLVRVPVPKPKKKGSGGSVNPNTGVPHPNG